MSPLVVIVPGTVSVEPLPVIPAVWVNWYRYVPGLNRKRIACAGSDVIPVGVPAPGTVAGGLPREAHAPLASSRASADTEMCGWDIA